MTATAARKPAAPATPAEDDFWGEAPAAAWEPNEDQARQSASQAGRRPPAPANDAHRTPSRSHEAPWGLSGKALPRAAGVLRNRIALCAAAGAVLLMGAAAAALTFASDPAEAPATLAVQANEAPASETPTPELAAAPAAEVAVADERKAQALAEAADAGTAEGQAPAMQQTAADPITAQQEPVEVAAAPQAPTAEADVPPAVSAAPAMAVTQTRGIGSDAAAAPEAASDFPPDEMATAALAPAGQAAADDIAGVEGAGSEPQVMAGVEETDAAAAPSEIELLAATATKTTVKKWVNMRTGPDDDAASITVIPADAEVSVMSCDGWCHVIYEGQQGWVYKTFVRGAEELAAKSG